MYEWPRKLCFADCAKFGVSKYCNPILFFISTCLFPRIQSARGGMIDPHAWVMSMNDATLPRKRLKLLGSKHPLIPDTFPKKCSRAIAQYDYVNWCLHVKSMWAVCSQTGDWKDRPLFFVLPKGNLGDLAWILSEIVHGVTDKSEIVNMVFFSGEINQCMCSWKGVSNDLSQLVFIVILCT